MRVLWVSNSAIGPAAAILERSYAGSSGGWIQTVYEEIQNEEHEMYFLCTDSIANKGQYVHKSGTIGELYCLPILKLSYGVRAPKKWQALIKKILEDIQPDVIHIWGTETLLSNEVAKISGDIPKVLFIQGLLGVHQRYLGGRFGDVENKKYIASANVLARVKKYIQNKLFKKQAFIEQDTILRSKNVIIDNVFSEAYCKAIAPNIHCYYYLLRPNRLFSNYMWDLKNVEKNSIFTIYGGNAEKGLQQLFKALAIVKKTIPQVKLYIPGPFNIDQSGKLSPSKNDLFECALEKIISDLHLEDNIVFLGKLNPKQMAERLSKTHIFVNPSCMEVHSMGLREALTVGVPSISSCCGSIPEYIQHQKNGYLYRYEEHEQLAYYIQLLLKDEKHCLEFSIFGKNALDDMQTNLVQEQAKEFLGIGALYKKIANIKHNDGI